MIKKWISLLTAGMLALALAGCGSSTESQQSADSSVPASESLQGETAAVPEQSGEKAGNTGFATTIEEIPDAYKTAADQQGEVVRFDYPTSAEDKYAYVYTPYGYTEDNSYDILYVMHGGGGSAESLFGSPQNPSEMKNVIDHLIENGEMRPMLIVTPTFYTERNNNTGVSGSWDAVREFPDELVNYLMPAVESNYSTYAETADDAGFKESREHRAFSGFSMGSVTTWYVFEQCLSYFHDFIPISGDSWTVGEQGGQSQPERTAETLANAVTAQGYTGTDFFIYAMTGSRDIAEPMMSAQIDAMKGQDVFRYTEAGRTEGNLSYRVREGGVHDMPYVRMYLYNALPDMWP